MFKMFCKEIIVTKLHVKNTTNKTLHVKIKAVRAKNREKENQMVKRIWNGARNIRNKNPLVCI